MFRTPSIGITLAKAGTHVANSRERPMPTDSEFVAQGVSRRQFVVGAAALGAIWFSGATACAREGKSLEPKLVHFTPDQGADVEAIAARIIPRDDAPGAREVGALYFMDWAMTSFAKDQAPLFADGLQSLSKATQAKHGAAAKFAALTDAQQDELLHAIEKTPFFGAIRFATIAGFLSLPKYGGNKDFAGWKYIGQDNVMEHHPPFGWYDNPTNQQALLGKVL